jgi:hypothetical protein
MSSCEAFLIRYRSFSRTILVPLLIASTTIVAFGRFSDADDRVGRPLQTFAEPWPVSRLGSYAGASDQSLRNLVRTGRSFRSGGISVLRGLMRMAPG